MERKTSGYSVFLDDERVPSSSNPYDVVCRNAEELSKIIKEKGPFTKISFDHDLGEETPTGYEIAKLLVEADLGDDNMFKGFEFAHNFEWFVHSQNPVGARNINSYLLNYLENKHKRPL